MSTCNRGGVLDRRVPLVELPHRGELDHHHPSCRGPLPLGDFWLGPANNIAPAMGGDRCCREISVSLVQRVVENLDLSDHVSRHALMLSSGQAPTEVDAVPVNRARPAV